jgi:hypothetical protein
LWRRIIIPYGTKKITVVERSTINTIKRYTVQKIKGESPELKTKHSQIELKKVSTYHQHQQKKCSWIEIASSSWEVSINQNENSKPA